jgi:SAM-dependent methyltransferase
MPDTESSIETRAHVVGFREEIGKAGAASRDAFFTWFDEAGGADEAFVRGAWDFTVHLAAPLAPHLTSPERKTVLEIGHGGGRILAAAARHFGGAIGIDVHDENPRVAAELQARGLRNVELRQTDGRRIPAPDAAIDVVYSFIVLQHVERVAIFANYVVEAHRVLKPGGLAILYFGRWCRFSHDTRSRLRYAGDRVAERLLLRRGYKEIAAPVNHTNLLVSRSYAARLAAGAGFTVLRKLVSHKRVPDGTARYGGQHGLILRK